MLDNPDFFEQLSSADPVPGGGSVAALETAMAASLLAMVANLTIGRRRYSEVQSEAEKLLRESLSTRDRALALASEDASAYRTVAEALALPRATDDDRARRAAVVQKALQGAVKPPLETMKAASSLLALASTLAKIGNRSAVSDVGSAALAARAGYHAARLNVEINLAAIKDEHWVTSVRHTMSQIDDPDEREREIVLRTEGVIGGDDA